MFDHGGVDFSVLASAAPGAELAAVLSRIDLAAVNGHVRVLVMAAWERQSSWVSAQFYESMAFVARSPACEPDSAPGLLSTFTEFTSAEVGAALCLSPRSADRELTLAYELTERLPGTHAALAAGAINLGKARTIVEEACCLSPDLARVAEEFILAAEAASKTGLSRVQLVRRLRRKVLDLDPEGAEERRKNAQQGRRVRYGTDPDGTGYITGQNLPMAGTAAAEVFIKTHAKHLHRDRDEADRRTLAQIEADVFLDLLRGRGPVASPNPATAAGGFEYCRTVTIDGKVVYHQASSRRYKPTAAQRRLIQAMHRTCSQPGCNRPAVQCDLDHVVEHRLGGPSCACNLTPLCRRHHRAKHEGSWYWTQNQPGHLTTQSPLGHTYTVEPEPPPVTEPLRGRPGITWSICGGSCCFEGFPGLVESRSCSSIRRGSCFG